MTISVVIPAYNEEAYIAGCIESVLRYATDDLLEIIVVCNACTDRTAEIAARYPMVTVVHEPRKGMGYVRQKGLDTARGDIYASLDADSRIHKDWFPMLHQAFTDDARLVGLSGPYQFYDLPAWQNSLTYLWWTTLAMAEYKHKRFAIVGGNFAARRKALIAMGGFDTTIAFWGEDTNIARRLRELGRVEFRLGFFNYSSARRLKGQGFLKTGTSYAINYFSQAYMQKTLTTGYGERPWERKTSARHRSPVTK